MERILNDEEKIRKAEEIYFRRNNQIYPLTNKKQEKKTKIFKDKFLLNLLIMLDLAIVVFCVQNSEFIFTKEFLETLDTYNNKATEKIISSFSNFFNDEVSDIEESGQESDIQNIQTTETESQNTREEMVEENTNQNIEQNKTEISTSSINEMELDIQNLKAAYTFVKPLNGSVSSVFGARESKYQNVTGYHTGIDIAADKGTPILASMQGIVELVSNEGEYGKHVKIRCNNVYTLYAHCSKIFVEEGQIVAEGQKIANVGNTGNSTGPHLHFEIRVDDRFVDPAKIIKF